MKALIIYILIGIISRMLCGYKGLVETILWPLGAVATVILRIQEGDKDALSREHENPKNADWRDAE